jgi:hypothetical protein
MSLKRTLGLAIAASALASVAALAATATPERVRGTVASATADSGLDFSGSSLFHGITLALRCLPSISHG